MIFFRFLDRFDLYDYVIIGPSRYRFEKMRSIRLAGRLSAIYFLSGVERLDMQVDAALNFCTLLFCEDEPKFSVQENFGIYKIRSGDGHLYMITNDADKVVFAKNFIMENIKPVKIKAMYHPLDHLEDHIHGDKFATMCSLSWNDRTGKNLDGLEEGGVVFCKTDYVLDLFPLLNPKARYIFVTHNSDWNITEELYAKKPDCVVSWFGQNILIQKPYLIPIPIGMERPGIAGSGNVDDVRSIIHRNLSKSIWLYVNFANQTNSVRSIILEKSYHANRSVHVNERKPFVYYLEDLAKSKMVLCPPGNGSDTHRMWEALYCGAIPVCEDNVHNREFGKTFPLILYPQNLEFSWSFLEHELEIIDMKFRRGDYAMNGLRFAFWRNLIRAYERAYI